MTLKEYLQLRRIYGPEYVCRKFPRIAAHIYRDKSTPAIFKQEIEKYIHKPEKFLFNEETDNGPH